MNTKMKALDWQFKFIILNVFCYDTDYRENGAKITDLITKLSPNRSEWNKAGYGNNFNKRIEGMVSELKKLNALNSNIDKKIYPYTQFESVLIGTIDALNEHLDFEVFPNGAEPPKTFTDVLQLVSDKKLGVHSRHSVDGDPSNQASILTYEDTVHMAITGARYGVFFPDIERDS